jgi:hypothetical protein
MRSGQPGHMNYTIVNCRLSTFNFKVTSTIDSAELTIDS